MATAISSRWKPGHIVRHDSEAGTYEEINPPLHTPTEHSVQHAFIMGDLGRVARIGYVVRSVFFCGMRS